MKCVIFRHPDTGIALRAQRPVNIYVMRDSIGRYIAISTKYNLCGLGRTETKALNDLVCHLFEERDYYEHKSDDEMEPLERARKRLLLADFTMEAS